MEIPIPPELPPIEAILQAMSASPIDRNSRLPLAKARKNDDFHTHFPSIPTLESLVDGELLSRTDLY
jgi:hypothetical protein